MRSDVADVMAERPKGGRTWAHKSPIRSKHALLDTGGDHFNEAANHLEKKHQKGRTIRDNVLERFLLHRVGRPWDKVYAEVCAVTDPRSLQGAEVRDYLRSFVSFDCWMEGRVVMSHDCGGRPVGVRGLYVHPKTGVLLRTDLKAENLSIGRRSTPMKRPCFSIGVDQRLIPCAAFIRVSMSSIQWSLRPAPVRCCNRTPFALTIQVLGSPEFAATCRA